MKSALSELKNQIAKDNKGLSLVELLVAIAIGAIVSGSIAALITISLRLYGKETVDVEMQQEIQTSSNFIIDAIMESDSFIATKDCDTVILGKFEYDSDSSQLTYSGYVFCTENIDPSTTNGKMYMKKYTSDTPKVLSSACIDSGGIVPEKIVNELVNGVAGNNANLLASNVKLFNIVTAASSIQADKYQNPFTLELNLKFGKKSGKEEVTKELHDTISLRNTLRSINKTGTVELTPVCIQDASGSWKQYLQPEQVSKLNDEKLTVMTESHQMETAFGNISTSGDGAGFKVLEIIPDYSADYLQYSIGGKNGEILDFSNVYYGDTSFNRITASQLSNYFKSFQGAGSASANYYLNSNVDIPGMIFRDTSQGIEAINNEIFKLFVLADFIDPERKVLDRSKGIWDLSRNNYCQANYDALKEWEKTNTLSLDVFTPQDLNTYAQRYEAEKKSSYFDTVDLIVFACPADGGFKSATDLYNKVKGTNREWNPSYVGDISWSVAKKIYDRVVDNKTSIACPSAMKTVSYGTNMQALYTMLFSVRKKSESGADDDNWNTNFNSVTSYGSGRDIYKNVTGIDDINGIKTILDGLKYNSQYYSPSQESYNLMNKLGLSLSDFRNYDYTGDKAPSRYKNQLIYNNNSRLVSFIADGSDGILGLRATVEVAEHTNKGEPELYGDIEIVGVSLKGDDGRYVPNRWGYGEFSETVSEIGAYYQIDVVKLDTPVKVENNGESIEIDKVIYLNDFEYETAKTNNASVYCIVRGTKDPTQAQPKTEIFLTNPAGNDSSKIEINPIWADRVTTVALYAPGPGDVIDGHTVYKVIECRDNINIAEGLTEGSGAKSFNKYIKVTAEMTHGTKRAVGTDYALVIVRDLFDLD